MSWCAATGGSQCEVESELSEYRHVTHQLILPVPVNYHGNYVLHVSFCLGGLFCPTFTTTLSSGGFQWIAVYNNHTVVVIVVTVSFSWPMLSTSLCCGQLGIHQVPTIPCSVCRFPGAIDKYPANKEFDVSPFPSMTDYLVDQPFLLIVVPQVAV